MINTRAEAAITASSFLKYLCKPLYESYCFSNIPDTLRKLFGLPFRLPLPQDTTKNEPYEQVIVLFLDSFGWSYVSRYINELPFLQRFAKQGIVTKITSQFPSTTAPHVTCLHTGIPVSQSGVYEWFYYDPIVDAPIAPLLFSLAKDRVKNTLKTYGINPQDIFPTRTLYHEFKENAIDSFLFFPKDTAHSAFSTVVLDGATTSSYGPLEQGLKKLVKSVTSQAQKNYQLFYYAELDSIGHLHGPNSDAIDKAIRCCFASFDKILWPVLERRKNTALLLIADHGMASVDPKKTVFLNTEFPGFEQNIKKNKKGIPIVPCGSCRDMFLHIEEEALSRVHQMLKTHLHGKAEVFYTHELMEEGLFGKQLSKTFLERVGNLAILPMADNTVWWHQEGPEGLPYKGYHGGLSREEVETTFLFLNPNSAL